MSETGREDSEYDPTVGRHRAIEAQRTALAPTRETLWGLAFEPLDCNGLGAQFLSLEGIGWGNIPLPSTDNGRRAF